MATRQEMLKIRSECLMVLKAQSLDSQTTSDLAQSVIEFLTRTYLQPAVEPNVGLTWGEVSSSMQSVR